MGHKCPHAPHSEALYLICMFSNVCRPGSVVPEVQLTFSSNLNESARADVISVVYNEVAKNGTLGNFTVSEVYAMDDGKYQIYPVNHSAK